MDTDNKLKEIREENDMTQQSLALMLNLTVPAYSRKENGSRSFTIDEAKKLAAFFNTTVEKIF